MTYRGMTRALTAILVGAVGLVGIVAVTAAPAAAAPTDRPAWVADLEKAGRGDVPTVPWQPSTSTPLSHSKGIEPPTVSFPQPARWEVTLDRQAPADTTSRPVRVIPQQAAVSDTLTLEVLDRAATQRVGASGFVFTVTGAPREKVLPVRLTIDYSGFADAYGAGYADRLQVRTVPGCALTDRRPSDCVTIGEQLPTRNDRTARTLTVDVANVSEISAFAVTSAVGGDEGTFAATPLSVSGNWQVSPGAGAFTYSYPIEVPKPAGGAAPTVALGYSSAAIDGLTLASNTQASPSGVGWSDFANAFVERRYDPCFRPPIGTTDLCWKSDNATISLGGISGPMIPINAEHTQWRLQSDPGWRVERLTGAPYTTIHQGQHWKVTGPDGTQYFFGFGHMPGRQTNSILAVPVVADNPGEPCRTASGGIGGCDQGWRWYLDRVVDPDGNVQSLLYEREDNWFWSALGALGGKPMSKYHRGATLKEIIYGGRGWDSSTYSARVTFGLQWRCGYLVAECPAPTPGHGGFPDVPTDLICTSSGPCSASAPSFFTGRRYSHVRTDVKIGTSWYPVAQHNIIHSFGPGQNGVALKLQVEELQHAAIAFGKLNAYPTTKFDYVYNDNRVDHGGVIAKAMRHNRLNKITNPFGGVVSVVYFRNKPCAGSYNPWPRWDLNVLDCYPQSVRDGQSLRAGVFNKYLVKDVIESPGLGSPTITTSYAYRGDPAWAFDNSAFARDEDETGWSAWRGYGTATVTKGSAKTEFRLFRGWHDDLMLVLDAGSGDWVPRGRRVENVTSFDGTKTYVDRPALAGRTLEERQLGTVDNVTNSVVQARLHEYETRITHDPRPVYEFPIEWVGLKSTVESVAVSPTLFRQRRSHTTYNHATEPLAAPQAATTLEEGWLDQTGDERCSITTYADNPTAGLYVYPSSNKTVAGDCASTQVLSLSETYYDGSTTLGAAPTKGNPTRQRTLIEGTRWSETTTQYDTLGRPTQITDPNGNTTTTAYVVTAGAPASQIPTRTTVTNAAGHQVVTDFHPEFGVPKREQDANGNVTERWYDEFGRLSAVWMPTEPVAYAAASWMFTYDITNRAVRSQQLASDARTGDQVVFHETWVIYDGFWRERQVQGKSSVAGKTLVAETTYDDRGLVREEMVEQALTGAPGKYLSGGTSWLNRTRYSHDELGRQVSKEWLRGTAVAHTTLTSYGADTVTVSGPDGHRVRERVDAHGNTVAVEEHDGQGWVSSSYRYDLAGRLLSATDPAGNQVRYTYNMAGWRTSQVDPNRGNALFGYDNAGRQTVVADALGGQIHTQYDAIGRQITRRSGSPTGPLLASWQYDTAPGGKGYLHRETAHTASGDWVSEAVGYDSKGRSTGTRLTVPAGIPGLSGTYTVTQAYDRADRITETTYPALGGLPQEKVTTEYNNLGLPTRMAGLEEYVWGARYDDRGRAVSTGLGPRPGGATWMARNWTYDADQRLNGAETFVSGSGVVSDHEMVFDVAGNLAEKLTRQNGLAWRECFGYDPRSRLTRAHTVAVTTTCGAGTPGTGDRPYTHTYRYSPDGKLTERVENGATTTYTYPAAGAQRPHAPTSVGGTAYTWDAKGNLTGRNGETLSWDVQGLLQSVTRANGTTSFVYNASGQRLLRRTPDGRATLYVAGHELTVNAAGAVVTSVRPYSFNGQLVATRTTTGVDYLVSDAAGSTEAAIGSGQLTTSATRAYEPYGQVRAQTGDLATDRGFLGEMEDSSTGLSYLNARYYDPVVGVFVSADSLYDTGKVKSLNPYSYAANNPVSFTDPSGLYSVYTFGLEVENARLRAQNKELIAHIGRLTNHIEDLQDVIRKQQKQINKLVDYARALEAEIARQASIIRQLQDRVAYLERVVVAQQREISRLRSVVARQQQIIRYQAGVIGYYKGIVNVLGFRLWGGTPQHGWIMASIHSFRGIPAGAFAYDHISRLTAVVAARDATIGQLYGAVVEVSADRDRWRNSTFSMGVSLTELQENWEASQAQTAQVSRDFQEYMDSVDGGGGSSVGENACNANSVAGAGMTLSGRNVHPYVASAMAGFDLGCVVGGHFFG